MDDININAPSDQPISDDQELAKALAGVTQTPNAGNLTFEETPVVQPHSIAPDDDAKKPVDNSTPTETEKPVDAPITQPIETPTTPPTPASENLDEIKQDALQDLRPLVEKLNLAPEEKFDIYLLLLRSINDKTLIGPAYEAARNISDETTRAQALLDVVKEIDYFSNPQATE